jgi:hypothetical protein
VAAGFDNGNQRLALTAALGTAHWIRKVCAKSDTTGEREPLAAEPADRWGVEDLGSHSNQWQGWVRRQPVDADSRLAVGASWQDGRFEPANTIFGFSFRVIPSVGAGGLRLL